jgi:hypothetical protein
MAAKAARERLEHTRRELLRHMSQDRASRSEDSLGAAHPASREQDLDAPDGPFRHDPSEDGLASLWRTLQHTARAWWQSHPAHLALEVAEPLFDKYARAHPTKVLTIAAATGAALVLAKPWRLISITGLLVAAARSTQVSALAAALLRPQATGTMRGHRTNEGKDHTPPDTPSSRQAAWQSAQADASARKPLH